MHEQGIGGARCCAVYTPAEIRAAVRLEEKGKKSTNIEAVPGAMLRSCGQAPRTHQEPHLTQRRASIGSTWLDFCGTGDNSSFIAQNKNIQLGDLFLCAVAISPGCVQAT